MSTQSRQTVDEPLRVAAQVLKSHLAQCQQPLELPADSHIENALLAAIKAFQSHALPAQPIKLYADSSNPDMFSRDLLDAAGNRYIVKSPTVAQFDIDGSALRAAGLEMAIDGMGHAPDGSSRAKMYWRKVDLPAEQCQSQATEPAPIGCDYCTSPLYAGTKCKSCGRVNEPAPSTPDQP